MNTLCICVLLACVAWQVEAAGDLEEGRAAQRGLLKRGLLAKGKQTTTTTTTPPPQESDYVDEEDYPAEGEGVQVEPTSEAPVSSTEGKKLVAGGVRPFRSNTDLLETLKRRRAQAAEAKHSGSQHSTAAPQELTPDAPAVPASAKNSGKKRFSSPSRSETANEDAPVPAPSKPNRNRFSRPSSSSSSRSFQPEPEAEEQNDAGQTRNTRTFSRRGGN